MFSNNNESGLLNNKMNISNIWNNETSICECYRLSKECLIKAKNSNCGLWLIKNNFEKDFKCIDKLINNQSGIDAEMYVKRFSLS